jgi:hypothetical protein
VDENNDNNDDDDLTARRSIFMAGAIFPRDFGRVVRDSASSVLG